MKINSDVIKKTRMSKGYSTRQLAKLCGVANSQVSDLESGNLNNTTVKTICKLADVLEINPTDLFSC